MPRAATAALTLPPLDAQDGPLHRQLYFALRRAILDGRLGVGTRLPSSRALAGQLGLSRTTVVAALDQLVSEGFVDCRQGSGTRVAAKPAGPSAAAGHRLAEAPRRLSRRAEVLALAAAMPVLRGEILPFAPGLPDLEAFPHREWSRLLARRWRHGPRALMVSHDAAGYAPLRAAIAEHLGRTRAVRCTPDQVVVVAGSQQGLNLAVRLLLDPGDQAMVEDPCYGGLRGVLVAAGAEPVPVPVDGLGFDPTLARRLWPRARLACVTPSHQFPTGATMPVERRLELIRWAAETGGWIIEDDYDSDFRYAGAPLAALQGLDGENRTLYLGTFSKSMFPALRLGWMVVPEDLLPLVLTARRLADMAPSALTQAAVADFMEEGLFAAHLRRMRARYAHRRDLLLEAADRYLPERVEVTAGDAGTNAIGWLPSGSDDGAMAMAARRQGLAPLALSGLRLRPGRPGLVLGYGAMADAEVGPAVRRLALVLEKSYSLL